MNDAQLIEELGGPAKLAKRLGFTVQRVTNWRVRGIPPKVKIDHQRLCLKRRKVGGGRNE